MNVRIKLLDPRARIPRRAYKSAGYDLFSMEDYVFTAGERRLFKLGFATEFDEQYVALVRDRGSMGMKGVTVLAGVIDADYRGEWGVVLLNTSSKEVWITPEKGIAQVLFVPRMTVNFLEAELGESERGSAWKGSSDVQG